MKPYIALICGLAVVYNGGSVIISAIESVPRAELLIMLMRFWITVGATLYLASLYAGLDGRIRAIATTAQLQFKVVPYWAIWAVVLPSAAVWIVAWPWYALKFMEGRPTI